jgi:Uma2 family endonuclease
VTKSGLGIVPFPPLRVRIPRGHYREPDVLFLRKENFHLRSNRIWKGADLVMEVVSPDPKDRQMDYEDKIRDYAEAKVAEYWIVDFDRRTVTVHRLDDDRYMIQEEFSRGQHATSVLLTGFVVDVSELFGVADNVAE